MDDPSLQCKYIEFDLSFKPSTIPKQCNRPRRHKGWLVVSDKADAAIKPRSLDAQGNPWIRQSVSSVPFANISEYVNLLHVGRGMVMPRADFSVSQHRRQWLNGWKVAGAMLQ